ncbi:hypothetical protein NA57DRAFT_13712, partial [Rhizodiscina lignyota]
PKLPKFRFSDVQQHGSKHENPWIIRGTKVYDITDWVAAHPGGEIILRAAGGSVEPYWKIFKIHEKQFVYDILEQYLIGTVDERDLVDGKVPLENIEDPFATDPIRDARLRTLTDKPCNAETPGEVLKDYITPNEVFYVRNHMWVPIVDDTYRLTIELADGSEASYSLQDLKDKFKKYTITSVMQCSGNRRKQMNDSVRPTNGLQWTVGGIGNATWAGVRLRDVLADAGFSVDDPPEDSQHAQFMGLEAYGGSIPIGKAVDAHGDVLLAYEMNGETLPPDHGHPIRVVVPGHVAARSVKWLSKITISDDESMSQWQRKDYKCFGPNEAGKENWAKARSIQEMPITSAFTSVSKISDELVAHGFAYSGGGREIVRVDVSEDNGKTWKQAELVDGDRKGHKAWAWKRWKYQISPEGAANGAELVVKATDEAYNTQPERYDAIYNVRGNLATAWHRVQL